MKSLEAKNYEDALKVFYDQKQKELEILLTNSIPTQFSNIKTLLWVDIALLGLYMQKISFPLKELEKGFVVLVLFSISIIIFALLRYRTKAYGTFDFKNFVENGTLAQLTDGSEYNFSQHLVTYTNHIEQAIKFNRDTIEKRAKLMRIATAMSFLSVILFGIMLFARG